MDFEDHVFCRNRHKNKKMMGSVLCAIVYLNQEGEEWGAGERLIFLETFQKATTFLEQQATAAGVALWFNKWEEFLLYDAPASERPMDIEETVLAKTNGFHKADAYAQYLKKLTGVDQVVLVFARKQYIWEYARTFAGVGACFLSQFSEERTIVHELLHLFGAIDLYVPVVNAIANYCFGVDCVMCASGILNNNAIDPLTKYLIGWHKEPETVARLFLIYTSDLTWEEYETSRKTYQRETERWRLTWLR